MAKVTISDFFSYMSETFMKKKLKKNFFQKFYFVLILWAHKVTPGNSQSWEYVLKANFETIFG